MDIFVAPRVLNAKMSKRTLWMVRQRRFQLASFRKRRTKVFLLDKGFDDRKPSAEDVLPTGERATVG